MGVSIACTTSVCLMSILNFCLHGHDQSLYPVLIIISIFQSIAVFTSSDQIDLPFVLWVNLEHSFNVMPIFGSPRVFLNGMILLVVSIISVSIEQLEAPDGSFHIGLLRCNYITIMNLQ